MITQVDLETVVDNLQKNGEVELPSNIHPQNIIEVLKQEYGIEARAEIVENNGEQRVKIIVDSLSYNRAETQEYLEYRANEWDRAPKSFSIYEVRDNLERLARGELNKYTITVREFESNELLHVLFENKDRFDIRIRKESESELITITVQPKDNRQFPPQQPSDQKPEYKNMDRLPIVEAHRNIFYTYAGKKIYPNLLLPLTYDYLNLYHSKNQNFLRFFNTLDDDTKMLFLSYIGGMFIMEYARRNGRISPKLLRVEEQEHRLALAQFVQRLNIDAHINSFSNRLKRAQNDVDMILEKIYSVSGDSLERMVGKNGIQHLRFGLITMFMEFQFNQSHLMDSIKHFKWGNVLDTIDLMKFLANQGHRHAPSRELDQKQIALHAISAHLVGNIMRVNPGLLLATIAQESNFRVHVHSLYGRGASQQTDQGGIHTHFNPSLYNTHFKKYGVDATFLTIIINSSMYADYIRNIPSNFEGNILLQYYFASITYIGKARRFNVDLWNVSDTYTIRKLAEDYNGGPEKVKYGLDVANSPYIRFSKK
ncbi:MAG: hypothetical protein QW336_00120 [Candidatus Anstonellales archaeon]